MAARDRAGSAPPPASASPAGHPSRTLVVSSVFTENETARQLGKEAYSYRFVHRAFAALLERWGKVVEVTQPESRLDYALWRARRQGSEPIHLSFRPLHLTYLTQHAANVAFPFWEFPDLPENKDGTNPRHNWVRIADRLALVLTASTFTRDAFVRAGVKAPVAVVPVPIRPAYFAVPAWQSGEQFALDCPCYVLPQTESPPPVENPWVRAARRGLNLRPPVKRIYNWLLKSWLPRRAHRCLAEAARTAVAPDVEYQREHQVSLPVSPRLELSGVVYTTILNPLDSRKNWQDLLSAFLAALAHREDATLVIKVVASPQLTPRGVNLILDYYRSLGWRHRCRVAIVAAYLGDSQMQELARASTYYLNTARAEGACLPLQDYLAAGRPGVAPRHTAMTDYFDAGVGWVVQSSPEPARWPHDLDCGHTTRWHRLNWQSLHDQIRASYETARNRPDVYQELAARGRERMAAFASVERVWPRLQAALAGIRDQGSGIRDQGSPNQKKLVA
jgi:glycosyltransferase involved in cell wall biosynthesis